MKRVLLIEDDRDIVELVRYNLEREGFQLEIAANAAEARTSRTKAARDRATSARAQTDDLPPWKQGVSAPSRPSPGQIEVFVESRVAP